MKPFRASRFVELASKIRGHRLLRLRKFWAACGIGVLLVITAYVWTVRSLRRAEVRKELNAQIAFRDPALEMMFPRQVSDTPANRELLAPGDRLGLWALRARSGNPAVLEVLVTNAGWRLFSVVGNQILATFRAGHREVTRVLDLKGDSRRLQVRFQYRWLELHPRIGVLGEAAPEVGREYEGEAFLEYENDRWKVVYWDTPLEQAIAHFRGLGAASGRSP